MWQQCIAAHLAALFCVVLPLHHTAPVIDASPVMECWTARPTALHSTPEPPNQMFAAQINLTKTATRPLKALTLGGIHVTLIQTVTVHANIFVQSCILPY